MTAVPVGFSLEASSGSMVHTSSLFTVLDMYRRQLYVGWSISAGTGIEIESGAGVCGQGVALYRTGHRRSGAASDGYQTGTLLHGHPYRR